MTSQGTQNSGRKLLGAEGSATRLALINAAAGLIREQGYPSATARQIAKRAGLKHQVIFYYFNDLNDLLIEVYRVHARSWITRLRAGLQSKTPLRVFWMAMRDPEEQIFLSEFMAMSQRNAAVREEIIGYAEESRSLLVELLQDPTRSQANLSMSPMELTIVMSALARQFVTEQASGFFLGHEEGEQLVARLLDELEPTESAG